MYESDRSGPEWTETWKCVPQVFPVEDRKYLQASLLLPLEDTSVKDHIVFWERVRNDTPIVTLSGLRGILAE